MRSVFERELKDINEGIATLSSQAVSATARAVNALITRNFDEAREVKRDDKATDELRYQVENTCLLALATQQPVATDLRVLRVLVAATFVATELERCGDYAKGVAKAARKIVKCDSNLSMYNVPEMDLLARSMLERSTQAFLDRDVQVAHEILEQDKRVDEMYNDLLKNTMADMSSNPNHIECGTWLLHAGHCLERIGDRATNIAERVIFVATGDNPGDLNTHEGGYARDRG
jgi:phosphate transport system protein